VARGGQRSIQGGFDIGRGGLGSFDLTVSFGEGAGEPLHLGGQQILRNGSGVVSTEQLLTFVLDPLLVATGAIQPTGGFGLLGGQLLPDGGPDLVGVLRSDEEGTVEVGDALFDLLGPGG